MLFWKFNALCSSERILQIDQELTKLRPWLGWHPFFDSRCILSVYCSCQPFQTINDDDDGAVMSINSHDADVISGLPLRLLPQTTSISRRSTHRWSQQSSQLRFRIKFNRSSVVVRQPCPLRRGITFNAADASSITLANYELQIDEPTTRSETAGQD